MPANISTQLSREMSATPTRLCDWSPSGVPDEWTLVTGLTNKLRGQEIWARKQVDLWELMEVVYARKRPDEVAEYFGHLLQPDIDLLYCETNDGERVSPVAAAEVKHFSARSGDDGVMPKLASGGGFYRGVGQALSLLSMGIHYVSLVHFVYFHPDQWKNIPADNSELLDAHRKVTDTYANNIMQLINEFDLPIGYIAAGVRPVEDAIAAYPVVRHDPDPSPYTDTRRFQRIQKLLRKSFNVF